MSEDERKHDRCRASVVCGELSLANEDNQRLRDALKAGRCHEDCNGNGELMADSMTVVGVPGGEMGYAPCRRCEILGRRF